MTRSAKYLWTTAPDHSINIWRMPRLDELDAARLHTPIHNIPAHAEHDKVNPSNQSIIAQAAPMAFAINERLAVAATGGSRLLFYAPEVDADWSVGVVVRILQMSACSACGDNRRRCWFRSPGAKDLCTVCLFFDYCLFSLL